MNINLYELMANVGKDMNVKCELQEIEANFHGEDMKVMAKDSFDFYAKHISKDVVSVQFDIEVETIRPCGRCLEDVFNTYSLKVKRDLDVSTNEVIDEQTSERDTICYIEDCTLDVDMLVLDELFTCIPMIVLCKDDCKGICKVCGTNLNKSSCSCDQTVPDPRLAVFGDIFNQFKEV